MKKFLSLLCLMMLTVTSAWADNVKTVTFTNDANWEKVFVWAWNDTENFTGGTWPGVELTPDATGLYKWSTEGNPKWVIFNDGGSYQTADQLFKAGAQYTSTGRVITYNDYSATFKTDGDWTEVWAYVWNSDATEEALGQWPGTKMENADGVYSIAIKAEEAPAKIIFHNNAGEQTPDLDFEDGKLYEYNKKEEPAATTVTFNFADPNFRENIGESMADTKGYIYNETFTADGATLQITGGSAPSRIYTDANRGQCLVTYKEYTTLTFNAPEGKAITKIEFTAAGNSNINKFTASTGTIEGMNWTGNADGVRFLQGGTSYLANAIVTMEAANGTTAALPAIEYTECANIAAFNALEAGTYAKITLTDAEVIGKSADGYSTVWVQDATGGAWIQYTSLNDKLQEKTKVNGVVYTIKRVNAGNPQLKEAEATINSEFASEPINDYTVVEGTITEVNVPENLNRVVKFSGATLAMTSNTAGTLTLGEETIAVNNGAENANQMLHKIADWAKDTKLENITITAILVAKSATENQLLPISIETEPVYTVVGGFTPVGGISNYLFGRTWTPTLEANDMEKGNNGIYTKTYENIPFEANTTILYKVVKNHGWDEAWGFGDNNADYVVNEAGTYNVTFTFNPAATLDNNFNLTCELTKVSDKHLLVLPEGVEVGTYKLTASTSQYLPAGREDGLPYEADVKVGFKDDKMYIQGLNPDNMDAWVYGIVGENEVRIPADQLIYIGKDKDEWLRFTDSKAWTILTEMTLSFDSKTGVYTTSEKAYISARKEYAPLWQFMYDGMTLTPLSDMNYYVLGDFWGENFDDQPQLMTQSTENKNIYTLVAEVTVEGKKYEYKMRQGDNWNGYQLPASGNQDWVFGTDEYPAGDYTLTFTANVSGEVIDGIPAHTLTLDVQKKSTPTGITTVNADIANGTATVYNLNGQKVQKTQKGLYIVNGRKVMIK